ncbi:hypothetical protein OPQ81_000210 [Rhizoctonia solani]|nr:hypothetical protein OPQ81_000210 [Rhizoctonia solani]
MSTTFQTPCSNSRPVSVSSRFNLGSWDMRDADVLLLTSDRVFFYAHRSVLLQYSSNYFGGLLVEDDTSFDTCEEVDVTQPMSDSDSLLNIEPKLVVVDIPSEAFNVVLLTLYRFPIQEFVPSNKTLHQVVPALASLGYDPSVIAYPRSELYGLLLKSAAADPLPMYAVAAHYSFESLAVSVSALTLRTSLHEITDELAQQMGPVYLRRLFCMYGLAHWPNDLDLQSFKVLHFGRADALRRVVLPLPNLHPPESNERCNAEAQKGLQRAWTLASAYIIAQNHPGEVNDLVSLLGARVECTECCRSLQERISRLVQDWSAVKCTI